MHTRNKSSANNINNQTASSNNSRDGEGGKEIRSQIYSNTSTNCPVFKQRQGIQRCTKLLLEHKEEKLAQVVSGRPEISESAD